MTENASSTSESIEPSYVGPMVGGHLRASDSDRDQVSTVLGTAYAEGRLTRDEYDERLDGVLAARTFDDLVGLTRDLVVVGAPSPVAPSTARAAYAVEPQAEVETDRMVAVFSGTQRTGRWRVKQRIEAYAVFGGVDLDMREATFEGPVIEINGFWCFGGLEIKVPEGVEVRDQTMGIFGGTEIKNLGDPVPGAPVLIINGLTLFGGVSVKGPRSRRPGRPGIMRHRRHSGSLHDSR